MDDWSVKNRTNGPYLIGPDGNYVRDATSKKPLMWDEVAKKASCLRRDALHERRPGRHLRRERCQGLAGLPAHQGRDEAIHPGVGRKDHARCPPPPSAASTKEFFDHAKIGSTITIDGFVFPFRPVGINLQRGAYAHNTEGVFADLVAKILMELRGRLRRARRHQRQQDAGQDDSIAGQGRRGGSRRASPPARAGNGMATSVIDSRQFYPVGHTLFPMGAMAILNPKEYFIPYETEILVHIRRQPLLGPLQPAKFEQIFAKPPSTSHSPLPSTGRPSSPMSCCRTTSSWSGRCTARRPSPTR